MALNDSVFRFADPRLGGVAYAYNFWTTERLEPGASYRLRAVRSDGASTTATVVMPADLEFSFLNDSVFFPDRALLQVRTEHVMFVEVVYAMRDAATGLRADPIVIREPWSPSDDPDTQRIGVFGGILVREGLVDVRRQEIRVAVAGSDAARQELEPIAANRSLPPAVRAQAHDHLARAALRRGRSEQARRHFESAEEIGREVDDSYFVVRRLFHAHAETVAGDPDRALALLGERSMVGALAALAPEDRWHFLRAIVLAMAGHPDEAGRVLDEFDRDVPPGFHEQFRLRNESARALVVLLGGDAERAVRVLEGIRTAGRCWACYAERMGWALSEAGLLREAAEEWEVALAWKDFTHAIEWQFTQNLWTLQRLPPLYEELGDEARALAHYRNLSELWAEADPELRPRVQRVRSRIAAIETARAGSP